MNTVNETQKEDTHDMVPLRELSLFTGGGGGLLASKLLGWNTVCAVEIEEYPRVQAGIPKRIDRLKSIGNGQVPQCAVAAWHLLPEEWT